ncbi:MAG: tRNA (adenosine(37)-N6)-threonylcarbamoyltransferase complex transferase subunit TsaD [Candidatus Pacebacteria bacterium]|nr:tRNA (adenosine(37)-N6)-threonylcarbamoyltransferase complex transferase subunit TsaD [Candidatus Paceibacterota bacterium]
MIILGIETSCDESAASIIKVNKAKKEVKVLGSIISSQIKIHTKYGGVVPEVAAREHVFNLLPVIAKTLKKANLNFKDIDKIAVTNGPGLITSLISGVQTAKTLSYAFKKHLQVIDHINGHLYSPFIDNWKNIKFPAISLTVSGGHTNLILMLSETKTRIIGKTLDDAAGEAYDKAAKMMNLGYPGGPIISRLGQEFFDLNQEIEQKPLPRPMLNNKDFNFSFSGLKTALLYRLQKDSAWKKRIPEYCYLYQEAITEILVKKTLKATKTFNTKSILVSGGVSANKQLRQEFVKQSHKQGLQLFLSDLQYSTDNATMIAMASLFSKNSSKKDNWKSVKARTESDFK